MAFKKLMIANRAEIAIRIARAAAELRIPSVAIFSADDAESLHRLRCDQALQLEGHGARAYLDAEQIIQLAQQSGCDAIHPGYGFLSENAEFAHLCQENDITFVGPSPELLELFGNKASAREFAQQQNVPVLAGTNSSTDVDQCKEFFAQLTSPNMIIKAVAGGGGRGVRIVDSAENIEPAFARCQSEAQNAFGNGDLYVEEFLPRARHLEVQIIGDQSCAQTHLWERDCSLQRRQQKIIEVAPSPTLTRQQRRQLLDATLTLAHASCYNNLGTFEFLLNEDNGELVFIEANARLQVEHTVTEMITGVDLVKTQIQLAAGNSLGELGLANPPTRHGFAIQCRMNMETVSDDGSVVPSGGTLQQFSPPSGPGVRVDTFGYNNYTTNPNYDSLLAKIICHSNDEQFSTILQKTQRAMMEFSISGVSSNLGFLQALLALPEVENWQVHTRFVDQQAAELARRVKEIQSDLCEENNSGKDEPPTQSLFEHKVEMQTNEKLHPITSPLQGTVISIQVKQSQTVFSGQEILILESMKMEHVITAPCGGELAELLVSEGQTIFSGQVLAGIDESDVNAPTDTQSDSADANFIRPDLQEVIDRHQIGTDAARSDAVAKRRKTGQRTARENIFDLIDPGSFTEYGPMVIASQRARRSLEELIEKTPADGLVGGIASVNGDLFTDEQTRCIVMSYDYTVFAGTQGQKNHRKKDRLFELAEQWNLPVIVFAEGGGGRPGETERTGVSGLDCLAFWYFAKLKGKCPLISVVSGRCFAGNAVLAGCSDVIIATENTNLGMGGPAMIEGGGLGVFTPEQVGPINEHRYNGVADIVVADEPEAVKAAKQYMSYFQGRLKDWDCTEQNLLRTVIPENRLRVYDVHNVIELMADTGSVLELRRDFAPGIVTAFARIEGRAVGIVANNPTHLGGAIDSEGADKGARFIHQCNAYRIPVVFLCDTPGIMVGPEAEKTGLVRHAARMFIAGASLTVPFFCIVLRKAYGLGAQTMAGGSFKAPFFTISWPTGEFGGMGLEGAVRLGYRKEIEAIDDPDEKQAYFQKLVDQMYEIGKATSVASYYELDDVIDPADSRNWIVNGLKATDGQYEFVDGTYLVDTW